MTTTETAKNLPIRRHGLRNPAQRDDAGNRAANGTIKSYNILHVTLPSFGASDRTVLGEREGRGGIIGPCLVRP